MCKMEDVKCITFMTGLYPSNCLHGWLLFHFFVRSFVCWFVSNHVCHPAPVTAEVAPGSTSWPTYRQENPHPATMAYFYFIFTRNSLGDVLTKLLLYFHPWMAELREDRNRAAQTRCIADRMCSRLTTEHFEVPIVAAVFLHTDGGKAESWIIFHKLTDRGFCLAAWRCPLRMLKICIYVCKFSSQDASCCISQFLFSLTSRVETDSSQNMSGLCESQQEQK